VKGSGSRAAHLAYVACAVLIWSTSFVATKAALVEVEPLALGAVRFALAALLAGLIAAVFGGLRVQGVADLGRLCLGGLLGITLYFSMENVGVDLATASDAALVVASYPAIAMVVEALVYRRRLSARRLVGVGLAIVGVNAILGNALLASAGQGWDAPRLVGNAILLATGLVWAFYNLATRSVVARYPMPTVVFWQTAFGALLFVPVALVERAATGGGSWIPSGGVALLAVVHLGVLCSVVAFLLYARGLKGLDASSAVSVMNLVPVFGVLFAVLLLSEPLGPLQVLGGLVVVAGVAQSVRGDPEHAREVPTKTDARKAPSAPPAVGKRERGADARGGTTWGK
jgi:drug/metabolite transporter (DMT)-like permease